jgi:peptidoglycan/xylan/chitin deacetylase (PgdA/CDA1 family)
MPNTGWRLARAASLALYYSGGLRAFQRLDRKQRPGPRCTVLTYHRIAWDALGYHDLTVAPRTFRSHLEYMQLRGYRFLSLKEYEEYLAGRRPLDGDSVLLTFDDGYRDNYAAAFLVLRELGIPATVFLCTGPMESGLALWWDRVESVVRELRRGGVRTVAADPDVPEWVSALLRRSLVGSDRRASLALGTLIDLLRERPADELERVVAALERETPAVDGRGLMLTWEMAREMRAGGVAFGAHSVTHPDFSQLSAQTMMSEILESKRCIERHLDCEVTSFAYPYGKTGHLTEAMVESLMASGFRRAFTTENGRNDPHADPFALRRNGMRDVPPYVLAARLAGVFEHPALEGLRRRVEGRR